MVRFKGDATHWVAGISRLEEYTEGVFDLAEKLDGAMYIILTI